MIIGVSGKKQHGKDTVAKLINYVLTGGDNTYVSAKDFLQYYEDANRKGGPGYPFEIKKFATKLREIVALLIGCTVDQLEDNKFKESLLGEEWRIWYWAYKSDGVRVGSHIYSSAEEAQMKHLSADTIFLTSEVLTPRKLLQLVGTECGREILHPNLWVNALMADYKANITNLGTKDLNWIITDVRFPNEIKAIEDKGGIILRVNRNLRPSSEWQAMFPAIKVLDPDGWDRQNYNYSWFEEHISLESYKGRIMYSTCKFNNTRLNIDRELEGISFISQYFKVDNHYSETALDTYPFEHVIENNGTLEDLTNQVNNFSQLISYD